MSKELFLKHIKGYRIPIKKNEKNTVIEKIKTIKWKKK